MGAVGRPFSLRAGRIWVPEQASEALLADKGHDIHLIRDRQLNRIKRSFGHLKIDRAVATRFDKLARSFSATRTLHLPFIRRL